PAAVPGRRASLPSGAGRRSGRAAARTNSLCRVDQPMNDSSRVRPLRTKVGALALVAVVSAATTAVVLPQATAQSAATTAPAPQLVQGLPDFTNLVDRVGPAVVSIEAVNDGSSDSDSARAMPEGPGSEAIPEIFRRFFGPEGFPDMPRGGPRQPRGFGVSMGTGFIISADG